MPDQLGLPQVNLALERLATAPASPSPGHMYWDTTLGTVRVRDGSVWRDGVGDGDKGDVVVSSAGTVWSLDPTVVTTAGRALIDDASATAQRTTLGLTAAATQVFVSGTWTPTITGSGGGGTITYSTQAASYVRIGEWCQIQCYVALATLTTAPVGNVRVGTLPFSTNATAQHFQALSLAWYANVDLAAATIQLGALLDPNTSTVRFDQTTDNGVATQLPTSALTATSGFMLSGMYRIAV